MGVIMTNKNEVLTTLKDHMEDDYTEYTEQENIEQIVELVDEMFRTEISENEATNLYKELLNMM